MKETLRRVRKGGIVLLFPEGTRSRDGELAEIKSGISALALRARVPVVPVAIAGTFEAWPRSRPFPRPHAIRIVFGAPITPDEILGLSGDALTTLIQSRIRACHHEALLGLTRDLGLEPPATGSPAGDEIASAEKRPLGDSGGFD